MTMQKPKDIICEVCGKSLPREEFAKGRAVWIMGKNYCTSCKANLDEKKRAAVRGSTRPGAPQKARASDKIKPSSGQIPIRDTATPSPSEDEASNETGKAPRRVLASTSGRKETIAAVLVFVAVASVAALLLYRSRERALQEAEARRKAKIEKMVAEAREYVKSHADNPMAAILFLEKTINDLPADSPFRHELTDLAKKLAEQVEQQNRERAWEAPLKELKTALEEKTNEKNAIKLAQRIVDDPSAPEKYKEEARQLIPKFWLCLAEKAFGLAKSAMDKSPPDIEAALDFLNEARQQAETAGESGKELLGQIEIEIASVRKRMEAADIEVDYSIRDLLAEDVLQRWTKEGPIKVERKAEWLLLRVPGGTTEENGIFTTPPDMGWRNFTLEMSFSITKKGFTLQCRSGGDGRPFSLDFKPPTFAEGNDYHVVITMSGDAVKVSGADVEPREMRLTTGFAPRGGIRFKLSPRAEVRIFEMKICPLPR